MADIVDLCIVYLSYGNMDVYEMCEKAFRGADVVSFDMLAKYKTTGFEKAWQAMCSDMPRCRASELFSGVGCILGTTEAETQIKRLNYVLCEIKKEHDAMLTKLNSERKLYYTFAFFIGIVICIMLV